ncbi:MarR family transcriptional regulator [Vibrio splendidus]
MNNKNHALTTFEHRLFSRLVNSNLKGNNKFFDKHDNCFNNLSFREIANLSGESKSSINRLFLKLGQKNLIKKVKKDSSSNTVFMVNPQFWCGRRNWERKFLRAMYQLGCYHTALSWASKCRNDRILYDWNHFSTSEFIDQDTGEIIQYRGIRTLSVGEVLEWKHSISDYTCNDRTKSRAKDKVDLITF